MTVSCSCRAAQEVDRWDSVSSFYSRRQMGGEGEVVGEPVQSVLLALIFTFRVVFKSFLRLPKVFVI